MAQEFRYQHLRSREAGRLPSVREIREGELAVNFADEKIYLKNINNQIVGFITDKQVDAKIAAQSGASEAKIDALSGNVNTLNDKVDSMSGTVNTELASKVNTSTYNAFTANTNTALNNKADASTTYTKTEVDTALGNKVNNTTYNTFTANTNTTLASKANASEVYTKTQVDTELGKKVNASTYNTFTANTNTALASKANANDVYTKTQVDTSIANFFDGAEYNSSTKKIIFKHGTTQKAEIDATDFIKDGMVSNVEIKDVQGTTCLVITFNTDSGKEPINIPISNIFDASNYYTKAEVDTSLSAKADKNDVYTKTETDTKITSATSGKVDTTAFNTYSAATETKINGKVDNSTYNTFTANTNTALASKANASDVYTKTETNTAINNATSGKVDTSTFNSYSSATETKINSKVDATTYNTFTANTNTALGNKVDNSTYNTYTAATETTINGKLNTTDFNTYSAATKNVIDSKANAGDVPTTATTYTKDEVNSAITSATSGKVDTTTYNTFTANTNTALSNKADSSALTTVETALNTHTADTVTHITSQERTSWNNKLDPTALDDYYDKDYINDNEQVIASALNDLDGRKLDASAYTPTDLSNYYQKSETSGKSEISTALSLKANASDFNTHTADTTIHFTTGDVQTQIDNSISGKVNTSDIVSAITPSNSGSTAPIATKVVAENELVMSNALNDLDDRKLDTSAYTVVNASSAITSMAGYSKASTTASITTGDSLNVAIGKLEKKADDAVYNVKIESGSSNGNITLTVNGTLQDTIYVPGLKGAAFMDTGITTSTVASGRHSHSANDITDFDDAVSGAVNSNTNVKREIISAVTSSTEFQTVSGVAYSAYSVTDFMTGHNTVTTLSNIPTTKRLVIATISSSSNNLTVSGGTLTDGYEIHIIVNNSSGNKITITFPSSGNYVAVVPSIDIEGRKVGEINIISDGTKLYVRGA